jgi:hypothetical protein
MHFMDLMKMAGTLDAMMMSAQQEARPADDEGASEEGSLVIAIPTAE